MVYSGKVNEIMETQTGGIRGNWIVAVDQIVLPQNLLAAGCKFHSLQEKAKDNLYGRWTSSEV
jgi:hypothetical protein